MKRKEDIMGMPITIEIDDSQARDEIFEKAFAYFRWVDETFSPFKKTSELSKINEGEIQTKDFSRDMQLILELCEQTKKQTNGYFDIRDKQGKLNPSGIVKGWAILQVANLIAKEGVEEFYVEAGGDIQVRGKTWKVGIENPFDRKQIIKVLELKDKGIATSGTYIRGQHIYDPFEKDKELREIVSLTVIGPDIYEADRFATSAFAMGREGINFIEKLKGFEGYMMDQNGMATMTSNFEKYVA